MLGLKLNHVSKRGHWHIIAPVPVKEVTLMNIGKTDLYKTTTIPKQVQTLYIF